MNKDKLIICHVCKGNACYEFEQPELTTWFCVGCGFTTNSQQSFSNKKFKIAELESSLPELIKDLRKIDEKGYVWYPSVINENGKGMIFADGSSKEKWRWSAIKSVEIYEDEKEKYKNPKGGFYKYKSDPTTLKQFEQMDFLEALDYIGFFK